MCHAFTPADLRALVIVLRFCSVTSFNIMHKMLHERNKQVLTPQHVVSIQ